MHSQNTKGNTARNSNHVIPAWLKGQTKREFLFYFSIFIHQKTQSSLLDNRFINPFGPYSQQEGMKAYMTSGSTETDCQSSAHPYFQTKNTYQ